VAPGVERKQKEGDDKSYDIDNVTYKQAQDREYFRYVLKVIKVLEKDPTFYERSESFSEAEVREGKLTDGLYELLQSDTKEKLDHLKKKEIEHQENLLADNRLHMAEAERNEWNPIHHGDEDKGSFTQVDLTKLLSRFNDIATVLDEKRKAKFKKYVMKKEIDRRDGLKDKSEEEKAEAEKKFKEHKTKRHAKMHQPGHKEQMKEVWEKMDGLDPESFDYKTFFNMHDKNSDDFLDKFELETLFLKDLDKVYDEEDPDTDPNERNEEMERMREYAMNNIDVDQDGLISLKEFMRETTDKDFEMDEEWKPLTETEQFTEDDLEEFRSELDKAN